MPLPGGMMLNGDKILAQADKDIERLEYELIHTYQEPPHMFLGLSLTIRRYVMVTKAISVYWLHFPNIMICSRKGYIGVSVNPSYRLRQHIYSSKNGWHENLHLKRVFEKYNDNVCQTILLEGSEKYCYEIEQKMRPKKQIGWNIAEGGIPATKKCLNGRRKKVKE